MYTQAVGTILLVVEAAHERLRFGKPKVGDAFGTPPAHSDSFTVFSPPSSTEWGPQRLELKDHMLFQPLLSESEARLDPGWANPALPENL